MKDFDPAKLAKQVMDFQKSAFDSSYNALVAWQGQTEKMTSSLWGQNPAITPESQKVINEWSLAFKKSQTDFKKTIDESFDKFESFFMDAIKSSKKDAK
jgi:hypothetical protein